jgi:hypothetical protein
MVMPMAIKIHPMMMAITAFSRGPFGAFMYFEKFGFRSDITPKNMGINPPKNNE